MNTHTKQRGFTAIELLITLFIAATFLTSGYQIYILIIKDSGTARAQSRANNLAYAYLQKYKTDSNYIKATCEAASAYSGNGTSEETDGLAAVTITVAVTCPYSATTSISKITSTVNYSYGNSQQTAAVSTYSSP